MDSVFSPEATVSAWLEFEAALALALADVGIAPEAAARRVAEACSKPLADASALLAATWTGGTPIPALRDEVVSGLDDDTAQWFHHGATTQDVTDTGLMLQASRGLELIDADLRMVAERLRELTWEFRQQPHMGRTLLQNARPTTFGLRTAGWLNAVLGHLDAVHEMTLPIQLGGSNGTRSIYGGNAPDVVNSLAARIGLTPSLVVWHSDRTAILSIVQLLDRIAATMAKIATDVALLASSQVSEITVRSGGSSSMPEKKNPIDPIRAIAAAAGCHGALAMIDAAPPFELDRGIGGWQVEWLAVPLAFRTAAASVDSMRLCLGSLQVDRDVMSSQVRDEIDLGGIASQIEAVLDRAGEILGDPPPG